MTNPPINEITPSTAGVDDEIVVTLRLRADTPEARDAVAADLIALALIALAPGRINHAIGKLYERAPGIHLAGIEVHLPDFQPYQLRPPITTSTEARP